ncbi:MULTISPECIES: hypothetical protein [Bacteroidota]|jgi:hypothetical protein|nr:MULTISPECIES: hypothetical protein [Bacteroidota]OJU74896.1 MAG: hypothetical protein BGO09_07125 [Bacteroidetes bacterium 47-18]KUJ57394.1 hypothetical protein AR686_01070 [Chryseobacterium aquaticum subsp. greenlandense]MBB5331930.1 hypothetical protein [Chryseobacterium koreense]MBE9394301.1 hypothetical protein [Elizabethkingia anophelis]MBE9407152.1 hypothetical protein [Elizabethkingia anophelis]
MKGKIVMLSAASVLTLGAALHVGHQPPADGICPLGKIIHGKQSRVAESNKKAIEFNAATEKLVVKK